MGSRVTHCTGTVLNRTVPYSIYHWNFQNTGTGHSTPLYSDLQGFTVIYPYFIQGLYSTLYFYIIFDLFSILLNETLYFYLKNECYSEFGV